MRFGASGGNNRSALPLPLAGEGWGGGAASEVDVTWQAVSPTRRALSSASVCAPALIKSGLRDLADLSRKVLIHLTSQPRAWPAWLIEAGMAVLWPRGHLWVDSVPAMLEAAEQGLGVTLAMAPLIKARPGFGRKLVAPFDVAALHTETIYLVSRAEQARDRRISALRRWIIDAIGHIS